MNAVAAPRATSREWIGLAVLALPCLLYSMDLTVLHLAVPALSRALAPSATQLLWIIDIYGFLVAGSLVTMGTLGDRIGRRKLLLIGAALFGLASVLAAFSSSATMLIATRALLGVAGATVAPSTLSLIRTMFRDPQQRTVAIGVWITSYSAGGAVGPLFGGLLLERFWWGAVFLAGVPVMLLLLVLGPILLPEYRDPRPGRLDLPSAALSLGAVLSLIFGLKQLAQEGPGWTPALAIVAGLALGAIFVRRQQTLPDPLLDLRLFADRAFSISLVTFTLAVFATFGGFLFLPQYLQLVRGLTPLQSGLWTLPSSLAFIVGSQLAPVLVRRARPATVMTAGLVAAAAGFAMLTQLGPHTELALLVIGSVVFSLGLAPVFTLATDLIVGAVAPERAGAASAISETSAELGGALGIAGFGSLGTAIYRSQMAGAAEGLAHEAAEAARDTLSGALTVAGQLPEPIGSALLEAARQAFTLGLQTTALVGAVIAALTAVLVVTLLRHAGPATTPDHLETPQDADDPCLPPGGLQPAPVAA
ncbi:MAG TPA: MFS transporter [Chloroflexota bacterium]|nr:MFS transporter [Chloroflexota bacterium]